LEPIHKKIIGCGSFFILNKVHTNPIGQIEDVVIDKNYRGLGYGKLLIDFLVKFGKEKTTCYKIVLNCTQENLEFYHKCGFKEIANQCKYIK
jgi:glucosamine-phosphate N-acetyltransferase